MSASASIDPQACPVPGVTIRSRILQAQQKSIAFLVVVLPPLGTIYAIWLAVRTGIGPVEIGLFALFHALTTIGATVGFHRHFAHKAFEARPWVRRALGILGSMAAQGPLAYWVATHRRHHTFSDEPCDPHSPNLHGEGLVEWLKGQWHAHIQWLFISERTNTNRFARDVLRDALTVQINGQYLNWVAVGLVVPAVLGGLLTMSWIGVLKGFLWGGLVRMFAVHHAFWAIGGIAHSIGWRAFDTKEDSRNNFWLAIPNYGEGWHNNHHAFPNSAYFGLRWWQLDVGAWVVNGLKALGLITNVNRPTPEMIAAKAARRRNRAGVGERT
jgi:stearoyl-CoA desaturase (Delta-9 desaturase)